MNDFLTSEECQLIRERAEPHLEEAFRRRRPITNNQVTRISGHARKSIA